MGRWLSRRTRRTEEKIMNNDDMLEALENSSPIFSMLAGMKQQAIDAGFSPEVAELIVLEMLKNRAS